MKEQFDKKLVQKIKDSFANHQEPIDPQAWEKFSAAYFKSNPSKRKLVWVWWTSGIASSLLIALMLFPKLLQNNDVSDQNLLSQQGQGLQIHVEDSLGDKESVPIQITGKDSNLVKEEQLQENPQKFQSKVNSKTQKDGREELSIDPKGDLLVLDQAIKNGPELSLKDEFEAMLATNQKVVDELISNEVKKSLITSLVAGDDPFAQRKIEAWLLEGQGELKAEISSKEKPSEFIRLGVLLAPQNISNSTQNLNIGAGLVSEFSFSKRLKLDLGFAYAQQSLSPAVNNEVRALSNYDTPDAADIRLANFSNNFVNASYELSFGQLELPLNLKYKLLDKQNSDFYLITGVSNMVYLNQKNVGTITTANFISTGLMGQQSVARFTETIVPSDANNGSEVNVGQMVNFSLGYEHNLKNGTFISFEPFYKMSIGGQTFVNQQFGIAGMNLRMNFQIKNK